MEEEINAEVVLIFTNKENQDFVSIYSVLC